MIALLLFLLMAMGGNLVIGDFIFQAAAGWALHAWRGLPILASQWRSVIPPLCSLMIAVVLLHRFLRWWVREKKPEMTWRWKNTVRVVGILLGISGAAIAMSGITHQSAWLMSETWIENRGKSGERSAAASLTKQLLLGLLVFHEDHGSYPESLLQLEENVDIIDKLLRTEPERGVLSEPFILLRPGRKEAATSDEPLILSPYLQKTNDYVVGYGNGSVSFIKPKELEGVLNHAKR